MMLWSAPPSSRKVTGRLLMDPSKTSCLGLLMREAVLIIWALIVGLVGEASLSMKGAVIEAAEVIVVLGGFLV